MIRVFRTAAVALVAAVTVLLPGCVTQPPVVNPPGGGNTINTNPLLVPFVSEDELVRYAKDHVSRAAAQRGAYDGGLFGIFPLALPAAETGGPDVSTAAGGDDASGPNYSGTNLQEADVDESDVVKSDGEFFYVARGSSVRIVRAAPADQMAQLARLELNMPVDSLYLADANRVLAIGVRYNYVEQPLARVAIDIWPPYYFNAETVVAEIDVSDRANPQVMQEVEFDGTLVSSRLTNGRLTLVMTVAPALPPTAAEVDLDTVLPKVRTAAGEFFAIAWTEMLHPMDPGGLNTTMVVSLDAADVSTVVASTGIMASASTIYASSDALYVTDSEYDAENNYRETTSVHKLDFDENGAARYTASGAVPGRLLNQFSLGEHNGNLRLATHVSNTSLFMGGPFFAWAAVDIARAQAADDPATPPAEPLQPYNAVFVLGENAGKLEIRGALENIAPGERIYSARFLGDRGFLVTFVQIDPLFALDMSDPTSPKIAGELKIPGFSDYLHPLGDDLLIGVGRSTRTSDWGATVPDAVQLSLFDVSDLSNPRLIQQIDAGGYGSSSGVSYSHKEFAILPGADGSALIGVTAQLMSEQQSGPWGWYYPTFDGVMVYRVEATGFTQVGMLPAVVREPPWGGYGYANWKRAAFIGDRAYAISDAGVRAALLTDFSQTNQAELPAEPNEGFWWGYGGVEGDAGFGGEPVATR